MVGAGYNNGGSLYWNNANSSSGTVTLGSTSTGPVSNPNPIPSDSYWTSSPNSVSTGTYQDAGFAWGGAGQVQWGESVVTFKNVTIGSTTTFGTTFYNSTYDPPSNPSWAAEVAAIGPNMAQVAEYDSGRRSLLEFGKRMESFRHHHRSR